MQDVELYQCMHAAVNIYKIMHLHYAAITVSKICKVSTCMQHSMDQHCSHAGHECSLQLVETIDELQRDPGIGERYGFSWYNILVHIIQKK